MDTIQSTLFHKIVAPRDASGPPHPGLIMLHGRGANEDDLLGLADYLDERLFTISPRAPFEFEWGGGYTWYELQQIGNPEQAMFAESFSKLSQFLDDVVKGYPIDSRRLYFLGFSMGTMMAYSMLLTKPDRAAGVIANSGYVPEEATLPDSEALQYHWDDLERKSLFIAHGTFDPVIPVQMGRRAKEQFSKTRAEVTYREYPMAHQISEESLSDFSRWLTGKLDGRDTSGSAAGA